MDQDLAGRTSTPISVEHPRSLVFYGDFGCPMCYLASQRVDALDSAGVAIEWRAVDHCPQQSFTLVRHDVNSLPAAERALDDARALLGPAEHLPTAVPTIVLRTEAAVSAYAEACGAEVGGEIRRLLFKAYWEDGVDIGNPIVLHTLLASVFMRGKATSDPIRRFGYAVAVSGGPITGQAWRRIRNWKQEWQALGAPELPSLCNGTRVDSGERALRQLAKVSEGPGGASGGAVLRPKVGPGWQKPTTVTPPATWVSQVGNPWRRASLMSR